MPFHYRCTPHTSIHDDILSRVRVRVRVISPVEKEKVYGGKDLLKSQVLSSE